MKTKLTTLALAGTLVLATASTASALTLQQNLRNDDTQTQTQTQTRTRTNTPVTARTEQGETAPFIFGSTTTVDRATSRQPATDARQSQRRALNVQIRTVQRQYLNLKRAGNLRAAEPYRVELERLKAQKRTLNRTTVASR